MGRNLAAGWSISEKDKKQELQDMDYYIKNRDLLNALLQYAFDHRTVRYTSGLAIQQKYFKAYYLKYVKSEWRRMLICRCCVDLNQRNYIKTIAFEAGLSGSFDVVLSTRFYLIHEFIDYL